MSFSMHIIGSSGLGGAESFYTRLIHGLAARGEPVLAVNRPTSDVRHTLNLEIPQFHIGMRNSLDLYSRRQISRLIAREKPDIVQTYMTRATGATHIKPGQGTVHVARLGGYYKVKRFAHAHAWVGNTHGICDFLIRSGLPADRIFYIGNFVGKTENADDAGRAALRLSIGVPDDALLVVAAGRLTVKKGFDSMLAAFDRLPAEVKGRPVHLVLVGDGPLNEKLHQQATRLSHPERVHWAGWQIRPGPWFDLADVYVCPSRHEPLGNVILEAWAYSKPVVSTRTLGGGELIREGVDGSLVDIDDVVAMSAAVHRLLLDEDMAAAFAVAGHQRVETEFSEASVVGQYIDLYRQLAP